MSLNQNSRFRVREQLPGLVASLFSWRCLAASTSSFIYAAMNLRPPSATVSTHACAFNAVTFQSHGSAKRPHAALYAIGSLFLLPTRPLRTAPSRFPNTIRFGSRPPLIRMSVPAHKSLSCAALSQCSRTGLSQGHGCTTSSDGPVSCAVPR